MDTSQRIHNLIFSYAECVDEGDFETLGALFARGSISYAPSGFNLPGRSEITAFFQKTIRLDPHSGTPRTIHRVSNVLIVAGTDEWHARSRYDVTYLSEEGGCDTIAMGRYFDTFSVTNDDVWFKHRKVVSEFLADDSRHLNLPSKSDKIINLERAKVRSNTIPT